MIGIGILHKLPLADLLQGAAGQYDINLKIIGEVSGELPKKLRETGQFTSVAVFDKDFQQEGADVHITANTVDKTSGKLAVINILLYNEGTLRMNRIVQHGRDGQAGKPLQPWNFSYVRHNSQDVLQEIVHRIAVLDEGFRDYMKAEQVKRQGGIALTQERQ